MTNHQPWVAEHEATIRDLPNDWDPDEGEPPNQVAIDAALTVLAALAEADLEPTGGIEASVEGICLVFYDGTMYADVEVCNTGEVLAVTSDRGDETKTWPLENLEQDLPDTIQRIRVFTGR